MALELERFKITKTPPTIFYIPNFISKDEEQMLLSHVYKAPRTKWTVLSHRRLQNWGGLPGPKGMVSEDLPLWLLSYAKKIAELGAFQGNVPNHVLVNEYKAGQGIMPHEDGPAFYPTVSTISLGSHTLLDFYYHLYNMPGEGRSHSAAASAHTTPTSCAFSEDVKHKPTICSDLGINSVAIGHSVHPDAAQHCPVHNGDGCHAGADKGGDGETCSGIPEMANHESGTSFENRHFVSLLLQPRSLVLVQDDMYKIHLHGIKEVAYDTISDKVVNLDLTDGVQVGDVLERETRVSLTIRYVPKVLKAKLIFGK